MEAVTDTEYPEVHPDAVPILARDVKPYHYGIWCTIAGNPKPFVIQFVSVKWSEDGKHLWFMLDSHNFHKAKPNEELSLVPMEPGKYAAEKYADWVLPPPPPKPEVCPTCGHVA